MSLYLGENLISGKRIVTDKSERIGQIIVSTIPLTDAGLHLLDGALISGSGSYSAFVTYIAGLYTANPSADYFTTESSWQTSVNTYGVCGKFVYDSVNNTVRLPKYSNKIYTSDMSSTAAVKGNGMTLGLTNGTTNVGVVATSNIGFYGTPAMYGTAVGTAVSGNNTSMTGTGVTTDSAKSGIIADLSNITTSLEGYYYIVIATSTKTNIEVDIDEIATDLNGKADVDLTNCTKPHIVETYNNGASWYRVYSDGWCEQGGHYYNTNGSFQSIALLKSYIDTNYNLQVTISTTSGGYSGQAYATFYSAIHKTVSSFELISGPNAGLTDKDWFACGYVS